MNKILLKVTMMVGMLMGAASWAGAANYDNPIQGVLRAIIGNSITIEVPSLVSKSPTSDNQNGSLSFVINSSTNYTNFHQLSDLKEGDTVSIGYMGDFGTDTKTKQVVAETITKVEDQAQAVAVSSENTGNPQYVVTTVPASGSTDSTGAAQTVTTTTTTQVNSP